LIESINKEIFKFNPN